MLLILWFCCAMTLSRVLYSEQGITNKCQSNLTSIAIAMHRYHEKYGSLPPAYLSDANGKPMHSWRVLILEFIDTLLFEKYSFSEPWNGPSNSRLSPMMPSIFRCDAESGDGPSFKTSYFVVVGTNTLFADDRTLRFDECDRSLSDIVLVVEHHETRVNWMEPTDCREDELPRLTASHRIGPFVCMADGTVRPSLRLGELRDVIRRKR